MVYAQCSWLLLVQLYHSEVLHLINLVNDKLRLIDTNEYSDNDGKSELTLSIMDIDINKSEYLDNVNKNIVMYCNKLFLFQLGVWFTAIHSFVIYFYFIVMNDNLPWLLLWYWQLLISVVVILVMPFAMKAALNKNAKVC